MKIAKKLAAAFAVTASLSACSNPEFVGAAAGGLAGAALARNSSSGDRDLAAGAGALVGGMIGSRFRQPCQTAVTGEIVIINGQRYTTERTQATCQYPGNVAGIQPQRFN